MIKKVSFARRSAVCFFVATLFFLSCILRVAVIATGSYSQVQAEQSSYRITISKPRGTIFDRNMIPITNSDTAIMAAVSPTPRAVVGISSLIEGEQLDMVLEKLSSGVPAVCEVPKEIECDGIAFAKIYRHASSDTPAVHLIGYTDNQGHGASGLEMAYDNILYREEHTEAVFTINGAGGVLQGVEPFFENLSSGVGEGVVSTIDVNIQSIVDSAADSLNCGAVIVADAKTSEILAMSSRPSFDILRLSDFLKADNSPLINRAISAYSVGSVFKPCIAAAALENKNADFLFTCTGNTFIIDRIFNCHNRSGHGLVNLKKAIAFSCNTFFYNFAINIGGDAVYKMASALGFGNSLKIAENMSTAAGNITNQSMLTNEAILANFSIGQGDILLSPVSMLTLYCAIASDGAYRIPTVVKGTVKNGKLSPYEGSAATRVMSAENAAVLREYLAAVVEEGTGTEAASYNCAVAGKTATAQTGRYDERGVEITNSWFCGFFPVESPKYVVIVMSEGISKISTASVFSKIASGITAHENPS